MNVSCNQLSDEVRTASFNKYVNFGIGFQFWGKKVDNQQSIFGVTSSWITD